MILDAAELPLDHAQHGRTPAQLLVARAPARHAQRNVAHRSALVPGLGPVLALEMRRDPEWPPPMLFPLWPRHREEPQIRKVAGALVRGCSGTIQMIAGRFTTPPPSPRSALRSPR
jgi:hypothetical protein